MMNGSDDMLADVVITPRRRGRPAANSAELMGEERLLARAFAQFAERGYDATTVRDLARQLGISHNLLNVRFGRKSDLWKAAVEWRLADASRDVEPAFDRDATAQERLVDLIERFCQWAAVHPDIVGICYHEGQRPGWRLDFIVNRFVRPFQARLDRLIEDVRVTRPVSPIATGALLALLVHGVGSYYALKPMQKLLTGDAARDQVEQGSVMARFLIAGVFGGA
jgi:AcrR family transcriptional regulator